MEDEDEDEGEGVWESAAFVSMDSWVWGGTLSIPNRPDLATSFLHKPQFVKLR